MLVETTRCPGTSTDSRGSHTSTIRVHGVLYNGTSPSTMRRSLESIISMIQEALDGKDLRPMGFLGMDRLMGAGAVVLPIVD
jgi:hypothetical protein